MAATKKNTRERRVIRPQVRSRAKDIDAGRQSVMDAALAVLADVGTGDVRMRDVAERAGLHVSEVYRFFRSKEDLLCALAERQLMEMTSELRRQLRGVTGTENKLKKFTRSTLDFLMSNKGFTSFMVLTPIMLLRGMPHETAMREQASVFAEIVREGQREGEVKLDINISLLIKIYFGGIGRLVHVWLVNPKEDLQLTRIADEYAGFIFRALKRD